MVPLEASRLARHLSVAEQQFLQEHLRPQQHAAGERLFAEGDVGDGLYVVLEGQIEIAARSVPGREHRLAVMDPGDYFGEMALFDGGGRSASATAIVDSVVGFLTTEVVRELLERSPLLAAALVRDGSLRMREFNRRFLQESLKAERLALVERLARTIVHDFRNPLNVVGIAADIAAEERTPLAMRQSARDRIRRQVAVMNQMMQELLDFTRGFTISVSLPRVRLSVLLAEIVFELRAEADRRGMILCAEGAPPEVELRVDPPRLRRVFTNLAQNAFDALSGRPNPTLTLRSAVTAEGVVLEVADNGPGIPPEILPQVFEPFVTYGKAHGTGLGLAIVERIIAEHGGRISVTSIPECGATFRIVIPPARPGETDRLPRK